MKKLNLLFLILFFIVISCNNNTKNKIDKLQVDQNIIKDSLVENFDCSFIPAQTDNNNSKKIIFSPDNYNEKWQLLVDKKFKPKSKNNKNGLDFSKLTFGDFGLVEYKTTIANFNIDSSFYFVISKDSLYPIIIDSIDAIITYYSDQSNSYHGYIKAKNPIKKGNPSFVIQSKEQKLPLFFKTEKLTNDALKTTPNKNKPDKNGFYEGPYILELKLNNTIYKGNSNNLLFNNSETFIFKLGENLNYLLISWNVDSESCQNFSQLFLLENNKIKKIKDSSHNCDL